LEVVAELKFDIPKTYAFQRSQSRDISVALLRFSHVPPGLSATVGSLPAVNMKTKQTKSKTASKRRWFLAFVFAVRHKWLHSIKIRWHLFFSCTVTVHGVARVFKQEAQLSLA